MSSAFKKYDIRGIVPEEFNVDFIFKFAKSLIIAYPEIKKIAIGYDAREFSKATCKILVNILSLIPDMQICDLGLSSTENIYFVAQNMGVDLAIEITASHNPPEYCGIKFIWKGGFPFTPEDLNKIKEVFETLTIEYKKLDISDDLVKFYLEETQAKPIKNVVVNCVNGTVGEILRELDLGFDLIYSQDFGNFFFGAPNPMNLGVRLQTDSILYSRKGDYAAIFDGDGDRCVFMNKYGVAIEGHYTGAVLADYFIKKLGARKIVHTLDCCYPIEEILQRNAPNAGPVFTNPGHVLVKQIMREYNADYGFEFSGHNYYKNFGYCDSGILTLLYFTKLNSPFKLISELQEMFPCSGEINLEISQPFEKIRDKLDEEFKSFKLEEFSGYTGYSRRCDKWRFSIRPSNTEPVIRLHVEAKGNKNLVKEGIEIISSIAQ